MVNKKKRRGDKEQKSCLNAPYNGCYYKYSCMYPFIVLGEKNWAALGFSFLANDDRFCTYPLFYLNLNKSCVD